MNKSTILLKVYINNTGQLAIMELEEYVKGVLAAEIPISFHEVAMRAQAIASRTFAIKRIRNLGGFGCKTNPEADICTDRECCQGWVSAEELKELWGDEFESNWEKINKAVTGTQGLILTYNGNPIDAVYHSTCGGSTEDSENVWGNRVSYLRKVECDYCKHSPFYKTEKTLCLRDLQEKLGIDLSEDDLHENDVFISGLIEQIERTAGRRIKKIMIGTQSFDGEKLRELLKFPSTRFWWSVKQLTFQIMGYGHGVGLCQYGADGMAKQGKNINDILTFYYTGVEIEKMNKHSFEKPLRGKVITIDPGHGGGGSAVGPTGLREEDINLKICEYLEQILKTEEANVKKTRSGNVYVPLAERVRIANEAGSDLFISVHQNAFKDRNVSGTETFYYPGDLKGKKLAAFIQESLVKTLKRKDRGVKQANFYVLRETNMPSALVEVVFITNPEEEQLLRDEEFLRKAARGISSGIMKYYKI